MLRRFGWIAVFAAAVVVTACGRQVTPNPPNSGPGGIFPGYMSIKFDVQAPFNFSSYQYWIVFNTSGNGQTPLTNPQQNNWAAYDYAFEVGGTSLGTSAQAIQFVKKPSQPFAVPYFQQLITTPVQVQYVPNSNGSGTEFTITFQRSIFNGILASPSPSASPFASTWLFNAFTTQASPQGQLLFLDSMGTSGTTFVSPQLDINSCFDNVITALNGGNQLDPAATIYSVEIANNPSAGANISPCSGD